MIGVILLVLFVVIVGIYFFAESKRVRHKIFAFFLIGLVIFFYVSASFVFKGKNIDYGSVSGIIDAGKLYFSWLGSVFVNLKSITTNAIGMNWGANQTG